MPNTSTIHADWYNEPLGLDDILAGSLLIMFGATILPLYALVAYVMFKNDKDIIGFRYLFSASIADMMLMVNYALWPGITILLKSEVFPTYTRSAMQMYLDWAWFSMCYHYMVIAWSRFAAIRYPTSFRIQSRVWSYSICAGCYVAALVQVLCTHFQPWYVTFYYEPSHYGMLSEDFEKYLTRGQSFFFFSFHLLMMVIPIGFYSFAIILLFKHRNGVKSMSATSHSSVEARLIVPCIFNSVVFIIGQVVITIGTGEGKWATWTVMILFSCNAAVNPLLLILFSGIIRNKLLQVLNIRPQSLDSRYITVPNGLLSGSPSPPLGSKTMSSSRSTPLMSTATRVSKDGVSCAV
uniref:G protein-coupled receptor n=1 Tax=Panagrellus redivivus TaxID=6233 RepID=A0A7E4V963_PANRE